jgi:hypothetical protein
MTLPEKGHPVPVGKRGPVYSFNRFFRKCRMYNIIFHTIMIAEIDFSVNETNRGYFPDKLDTIKS